MLIALAFAVAAIATPAGTIVVHPDSKVPEAVVRMAIDEANKIWRAAGIVFEFRLGGDTIGVERPLVDVSFDDQPRAPSDYVRVIGWVIFDANSAPLPQIHLSYANAMVLMRAAHGADMDRYTIYERNTMAARALGRALAHELGHYLLASKEHTADGLMKGHLSTGELFGPQRSRFTLDAAQRTVVASRLLLAESVAHR